MSQPFNPLRLQPNLLLPALIMGVFLAITGLPQIDTIYTLWHPGRAIVFNDFMIHWEAARLVAAGRAAEVYDRAALTAGLIADFGLGQTIYRDGAMAWSYFYPPTGLLLIWPLGLMDYSMAALTMVGGGLVGYLLLVWRLGRGAGLLFVLGSPALWICLLGGQNSFFLAALLGFSIILSSSHRKTAAVMIAICSFKPPFLPVLCVLRDGLRQKSGCVETGILFAIFFSPYVFHAGLASILGFSLIPLANLGLFFCVLRRALARETVFRNKSDRKHRGLPC